MQTTKVTFCLLDKMADTQEAAAYTSSVPTTPSYDMRLTIDALLQTRRHFQRIKWLPQRTEKQKATFKEAEWFLQQMLGLSSSWQALYVGVVQTIYYDNKKNLSKSQKQ